jgi:hypothetical protein
MEMVSVYQRLEKSKTGQKILKRCDDVGHRVIDLSNPTAPTKGKITFICGVCKEENTTSYKSLYSAKQGCVFCKAKNARENNKGGSRKTDEQKQKTKQAARARRKAASSGIPGVKNREDLRQHLIKMDNEYSRWVLTIFDRPVEECPVGQNHHIIARHDSGPDQKFNLLRVTREEHTYAHELMYKVWGNKNDRAAALVQRGGLTSPEIQRERIKLSHETCKREKKGFFSTEVQSANGKKGGATQTEAKVVKYVAKQGVTCRALIQNGSKWLHQPTNTTVTVAPGSVKMVNQLLGVLTAALPAGEEKTYLLTSVCKNDFAGRINKLLRGLRSSVQGFVLVE